MKSGLLRGKYFQGHVDMFINPLSPPRTSNFHQKITLAGRPLSNKELQTAASSNFKEEV
jgi:hypothetical protein